MPNLVAQQATSSAADNDAGGVVLQFVLLLDLNHAGAFDPTDFGLHDLAGGRSLDDVRANLACASGQT